MNRQAAEAAVDEFKDLVLAARGEWPDRAVLIARVDLVPLMVHDGDPDAARLSELFRTAMRRAVHHEPETDLHLAADEALELFAARIHARAPDAVIEAALFGHADKEGTGAFLGLDTEEEIFAFLLTALKGMAPELGYNISVIAAQRNEG